MISLLITAITKDSLYMKRIAAIVVLALAACSAAPDQDRIEKDIVFACVSSGLFKLGTTAAFSAVPAGALPAQIINDGIDRVCADPARVAGDTVKVAEIVGELRALAK